MGVRGRFTRQACRLARAAMSVRHWAPSKLTRGEAVVGLGAGVGDVGAHGGDGEDAAARGDQVAVAQGGAGVDDVDVGGRGEALGHR